MGEALKSGLARLNSGLGTGVISHEVAPFGGVRSCGIGREGGQEEIEEYLETRTFHFGL